ncbi:MAG: hypothetical protein K2K92_09935 [Duncaniella sp.]|nr:hypothetical protein [Duncaniella sp.]
MPNPVFLSISRENMGRFRRTFIEIIQKDSPGKTFGFSASIQGALCFDLDEAVKSLGGDNRPSMDCMMRIGHYDVVHQCFYNQRWLLVELKLNSVEARKDHRALMAKVRETENGLRGENVDPSRNFIYPEDVYPQKKNLFESLKRGSGGNSYRNWKCFSPSVFETYLLFRENLPYRPENEADVIRTSLEACEDTMSLDKQLDYWKTLAEEYSQRGNRLEYFHILSVMNKSFSLIANMLDDSDEKEYLLEEWNFLKKY